MKERRTDKSGTGLNIEDTGRLLTSGTPGAPKKRIILIVIAAVLIAAIAAAGIIITAGNKRYDEQVAIAEKAFIEGDYQSAETGYLAAVAMNGRKPEAREGLAYVYAVQEKFDDSYTVYTGLYDDTSEEKYHTAAEEVREGRLPSDPSLVPGHQEPAPGSSSELSAVYAAYAEVLKQQEEGVKLYWWQRDINGNCPNNVEYTPDGTVLTDEPRNKCVAIKDISGDGIPELIYFSGGSDSMAELNIMTYKDGVAVYCRHDEAVGLNGYSVPGDSALFTDFNVAAGTDYIIYTGKEPGTFYIASSMGDETMYYNSTKYRMDGDYISTVSNVRNSYGPNADYSGTSDRYFIGGSEVSSKEGVEAFRKDAGDFRELLMLNGNGMGDLKVFEKAANAPQAAMTCNEAINWLRQQG